MERRRRATRLAIQRAAVDLFEEHGTEAVSVQQIAEAAGISPSTFRRYCASKEDAVTCHLSTSPADLASAVERRRGTRTTLFRALREGVLEVLASADVPSLDVRRTIAVYLEHAPLRSRWVVCVHEGQHRLTEVLAGVPRGQGTAGAEIVAGAAMTALMTAFEHWALDGGPLDGHLADCFEVVGPLDVELPPLRAGGSAPGG